MALRRKRYVFKSKTRTFKRYKAYPKKSVFKKASVKRYIKKRVKGRMLQNISQQCYLVIDPTGKYSLKRDVVPDPITKAIAQGVFDKEMLEVMGEKIKEKGFAINGIPFDTLLAGDDTFIQYRRLFRKFRIKFIKTQITPLFCPGQDLIAITHLKDTYKLQGGVRLEQIVSNGTGTLQQMTYDNILESRFKRAARTTGTTFYNINPYHSTQEVEISNNPVTNLFLRASSFTLPCICSCVVTYQMIFSEQNLGKLVS